MTVKSLGVFPKSGKFSYGYPVKRPFKTKTTDGVVGIEMELEGEFLPSSVPYLHPRTNHMWIVKQDGSLRNGLEYVTSDAIPPDHSAEMLTALFDHIRNRNGRINNSSRCSTHIHLNMQGFKVNQLASFVTLWGIFEEVLVNWCGPSRIGNLFALRLKDTAFGARMWREFIESGRYRFSSDYKYMALNGSRLSDLGTFEIRTLEGCTSADRPVKWIDTLVAIRTLAETWEGHPTVFVDRAMDNPRGFFEELFGHLPIFPELLEANVEDTNTDINKAIEAGAKMMLSTASALDWDLVIPETKRLYIPNPFGEKEFSSDDQIVPVEAPTNPTPEWLPTTFEQRFVVRPHNIIRAGSRIISDEATASGPTFTSILEDMN